jgi:hypothetical protein
MIYSRCKCGELEHWDSGMPPAACCPCSLCGTVPASGSLPHPDPVPHEFFSANVETDAGPHPLSRCRMCHQTKAQIARRQP